MRDVFIYPYNNGSESARNVRDALDITMIRRLRSRYRQLRNHVIINWGCTDTPYNEVRMINRPTAVHNCSNKVRFFEMMNRTQVTPPYATSLAGARSMIEAGHKVVCRTQVAAHSGAGIVIAERNDQLVNAPLYTQYIPKTAEYRIHVMGGRIIDKQRKIRNPNVPDNQVDWQVRSHLRGFIFSRNTPNWPGIQACEAAALRAMQSSGLDFGGVDVVYNERSNRAYVLEINTAPGLEGSTTENYARAFRQLIWERFRLR